MYQLTINKQFSLPISKLFDAWKKPELLQKWFAPGELQVQEAETDFKVGGKYRIVMTNPDGNSMIVGGTYLEIIDMHRLVFSWKWEASPNTTKVEINFQSVNDISSQLTLIHSEFLNEDEEQQHNHGWSDMMRKLSESLNT